MGAPCRPSYSRSADRVGASSSQPEVVMRALAWSLALGLAAGAAAAQTPNVILFNGHVYTVDTARPRAEGLAIAGDRISAVGTTAEMRRLAGPKTRVIDLKGAFVSPGFNDAHVHMDATGALLVGVNLLDVHGEAPFVERIRGAAARLPRGSWIVRGDWGAYEQWAAGTPGAAPAAGAPAGPFTPDRRMIDAVSPDHPVFVNRFDRSMFLANSLALKLAGVTESTPAPPGGEIAKDQRPPAALPGRRRRGPRPLARLRRRLAAARRLQVLGRRHHGQQQRAVFRAVPARPAQPRHPAPRDVPRGPGRRGDDDDRPRPLHALPARQPREAHQDRGALGHASPRPRHRRPRQPHPARRLRARAYRGRAARHRPPVARDPRAARPSRRLRALR